MQACPAGVRGLFAWVWQATYSGFHQDVIVLFRHLRAAETTFQVLTLPEELFP
jgi:hypothetical protein